MGPVAASLKLKTLNDNPYINKYGADIFVNPGGVS